MEGGYFTEPLGRAGAQLFTIGLTPIMLSAIFARSEARTTHKRCVSQPVSTIVPAAFEMLETSVAEHVLSALAMVARTNEVSRDLDLELFEHDLLDSLGIVELMVQLQDRLGLELSPSEIERSE